MNRFQRLGLVLVLLGVADLAGYDGTLWRGFSALVGLSGNCVAGGFSVQQGRMTMPLRGDRRLSYLPGASQIF